MLNSNGTLAAFAQDGTPVYSALGSAGTASPLGGLAIDGAGTAWAITSDNEAIDQVGDTGAVSPALTGGGLNRPTAIAIDGSGALWIANAGNGSVSVFSNAGSPVSGAAGFEGSAKTATRPKALAVDSSGNVWIANSATNSITEILGPRPRRSPPSP